MTLETASRSTRVSCAPARTGISTMPSGRVASQSTSMPAAVRRDTVSARQSASTSATGSGCAFRLRTDRRISSSASRAWLLTAGSVCPLACTSDSSLAPRSSCRSSAMRSRSSLAPRT